MAIYHFTVKNGSRKSGQSAAAKSDYILREGKYGSDHSEVAFSMSANIPEFAADKPRLFWEAADTYERSNARLFREIELSLPRELDLQQQVGSMERFAQALGLGDLPYTMAIHRGDGTNPHCHLMFSERMNDGFERDESQHFSRFNAKNPEQGGAQKTTEFRSKEWLQEARALWAGVANECLAEAGHDARIDHRSLEEQGVEDRAPQIHLGPAAHAMEQRGIETERGDQMAAIMDGNEELALLAIYEQELQQEVDYERGRYYQEPQGPEGGSGHDHAPDRSRGERQEPEERGAVGVSQVNEFPGREVDREPEHLGAVDQRYVAESRDTEHEDHNQQLEPSSTGQPYDSVGGTNGSSPIESFSDWYDRKLERDRNRDADRWYKLLLRLISDAKEPAADPRPDPAPQKPHMDLQPDPKPAQIKYVDLGVQTVEAGRPGTEMDAFDQYMREHQQRRLRAAKAAKAAAQLKDGAKAQDIDQKAPDSLERIESLQRREDEITAKQNSSEEIKLGEEGYDAIKEQQKTIFKQGSDAKQELGGPPPELKRIMAQTEQYKKMAEGKLGLHNVNDKPKPGQDDGPEMEPPPPQPM